MNVQELELIETHERFTRCWTLAQPVVSSFIATAVPDFHEAEDLLQRVAIVCLRKFSNYDAQRPFVAWALGIAKIELLRLRRAQARSLLLHDESLLDAVGAACEELESELPMRERALGDCLRELTGRSAELVRLRYSENLKPAAIAGRLGMGPVAVRVALTRVRSSLRDCIERKLGSTGPSL
jgi:RNA polymerase sigma-70 factor (ECF subfamily)